MIKKLFHSILGDANDRVIKKYEIIVREINALEPQMQSLTDDELKNKTTEFKQKIQSVVNSKKTEEDNQKAVDKMLDNILPEAFAVVREASRRVLGMRHFDVQLLGGIALHKGCIAEMKTGEGKTLVATLPAYLNALSGRSVHIITVNDYLVKVGCEWMGKVYTFLGLTVGQITEKTPQEQRKDEYIKDVVYTTNNEIGFDYLRDNMKASLDDMVLIPRGFNFAIVDEVDSILIDESRTPLIISGPTMHDPKLYVAVDGVIKHLTKEDYVVDEKHKNVQLTDAGNIHVEDLLHSANILPADEELYSSNSFALLNFVMQSLRAHTLFKNGVDYIVKDGQAMIIDEFTGRIMDGRRYSDGLHQAIEAKEGLNIAPENQTLASITYQNFFRMYNKLSGMTGTAKTEAAEFFDIYKLPIVSIPTNKKVIRQDLNDLVFKDEKDKFNAIVEAVKEAHEKGQPVLIGTASIEKSEALSELLNKAGLTHNLLNAKHHEKEAEIIAEAGRLGSITIATNMAGRGTDIMLGGNIQKETDKAIALAIAENQAKIEKASGIEGEDEKQILLNSIKEVNAEQIAEDIKKKHKAEYEEVVKAGGLFVIGSERHESRRIDNQLLGRAGRQGDPGKTQFYLSLQDNLLRIFGGEKIAVFLSRFGFKEGESMDHPMLNNIINKSQKKVEAYHYEVRKNLLKYDDIVNEQRQIVYEQRMNFVKSNNMSGIFKQIVNDVNTDILANATVSDKVDPRRLKELIAETYLFPITQINIVNYDVENINKTCNFIYSSRFEDISMDVLEEVQRRVMLQTLDECWREHLYYLDHIKEGIHLRAYAHKDPFSEYKFECYNLMQKTMNNFIYMVVKRLFNVRIEQDNNKE